MNAEIARTDLSRVRVDRSDQAALGEGRSVYGSFPARPRTGCRDRDLPPFARRASRSSCRLHLLAPRQVAGMKFGIVFLASGR